MFEWLKSFLGISGNTQTPVQKRNYQVDNSMNEGDIHSGPHGYSPNTPYQETQYGSRFDEDADWNDDEHQ